MFQEVAGEGAVSLPLNTRGRVLKNKRQPFKDLLMGKTSVLSDTSTLGFSPPILVHGLPKVKLFSFLFLCNKTTFRELNTFFFNLFQAWGLAGEEVQGN